MAESKGSSGPVPPTPLGGEAEPAEVPGMGQGRGDETIPKPGPDWDDVEDKLQGATDSGGVKGFARAADHKATSGVGSVDDRGTVAGVGTIDRGDTGTGTVGMEATSAQDHRTTEPIEEQGAITGSDE